MHPFIARRDAATRERLRATSDALLATKAVNGAAGLALDDTIVASIAMQAALPVLELGIDAYPAFDEIIVYPCDFVVDRRIEDEDGVVHEWSEAIAGESWHGGPIVLAWDAASGTRAATTGRPMPHAFNVVVHEFAHKLDMANGAVDGMPAFSSRLHASLDDRRWLEVLDASFGDFAARVDAVEASIPRHVDPDSIRGDRYYATLPFDAYAATDEGEFFSVTSEAFFVDDAPLAATYPAWHALLAAYYRQQPSQ